MAEKEDVIIFLEEVRNHLYGDLENFKKLCEEAELKEGSNLSCGLTTTSQTTLSPNFKYQEQKESLIYRSTIPHILSVFSTIDLIGFLIGNLPVKPTKIEENFNMFFSDCIPKIDIKHLTFFYRNGMAHTFFPKKRFGISAHSSNKDNLFLVEGETIVLNANYLIDLTKKRVDIILKDLTLISNMEKQFKELENYDKNEIKKREMNLESFIKELKNHKS
jgi:hypothetical protein